MNLKLVRRTRDGSSYDSWQLPIGPGVPYRHLFKVGNSTSCHIQRKEDGSYGFNEAEASNPVWVGPSFESPEAAFLWIQVTGGIQWK